MNDEAGLNSSNKPPLSWLWGLYKVVDRRYKKNLKTCFIVHPTSFIRVVYNFFKPIISAKFGRKIQYVNHLSELKQHRLSQAVSTTNLSMSSWVHSQQFGVTLEWII